MRKPIASSTARSRSSPTTTAPAASPSGRCSASTSFAEALEQAAGELNKIFPDDVQVYGFLADAHVELGHYEEATDSVQWMLDLRPGNVPALTRAAYLRELARLERRRHRVHAEGVRPHPSG